MAGLANLHVTSDPLDKLALTVKPNTSRLHWQCEIVRWPQVAAAWNVFLELNNIEWKGLHRIKHKQVKSM